MITNQPAREASRYEPVQLSHEDIELLDHAILITRLCAHTLQDYQRIKQLEELVNKLRKLAK